MESLGTSVMIFLNAFPISAQALKENSQLFIYSANQPQGITVARLVDNVRLVPDGESTPTPDNIQPNNAQTPRGQTPEELGQEKYLELVNTAKNKIANMPANVPIRFTIGVNYPVRIGDNNSNTSQRQWEVIGFVNQNEEAKPFTSSDMLEMFDLQLETLNSIESEPTGQAENPRESNSTSNRTENTSQLPSGISVIKLIAYDKQNDRYFMLPNVRFISVFRDALNATLNDEVQLNTIDMNRINPRTISPRELEEI